MWAGTAPAPLVGLYPLCQLVFVELTDGRALVQMVFSVITKGAVR